ncbi:acetylglutamate kinase [Bacillus sp. TS-2]|nr:acetylglutamate kinase [Bacillus sp. TS-2]
MSEVVVVKCGGSTISELTDTFFESIMSLKLAGKQPIIVHGGGPAINEMLTQLKIKTTFVEGLRKTTDAVLETAEMVLCGKMNKQLVRSLQEQGAESIGLSGSDGRLLVVKAIDEKKLGYVGEPVYVNSVLINELLQKGYIPVIAPIGIDDKGQHFNVNADSAAAAIASAMDAEELVFVTDVDGILKDNQLLDVVTSEEIEHYIQDGTIYGGMIPKVKAAIKSLTGPLNAVWIMNGKGSYLSQPNSKQLLYGTKIVKKQTVTSML